MVVSKNKDFKIILGIFQNAKTDNDGYTTVTYYDLKTRKSDYLKCKNSGKSKTADIVMSYKEGMYFTAKIKNNVINYIIDIKRSGIHSIIMENGTMEYVISGKVCKVSHGNGVSLIMLPAYKMTRGALDLDWVRVNFWHKGSTQDLSKLKVGDYIVCRGYQKKKVVYKDFPYIDFSGGLFLCLPEMEV